VGDWNILGEFDAEVVVVGNESVADAMDD